MPRVMKQRCESPCLPEGGVYDSKFEPHIRKNIEKYLRNFEKVSQSLNSRENDLFKNLDFTPDFWLFFYLRNKTSCRQVCETRKIKTTNFFPNFKGVPLVRATY